MTVVSAPPGFAAQEPVTTTTGISADSPAVGPDGDSGVSEQIVVSAELEPLPAETIGSSVTVIAREELERSAAPTLLEAIRHAVGIELTASGSMGRAASLRIRGGDASQTLVLLDGVRINSTTTGDYDFSNLLVDDIERVEILRGPQAIYGSEAVSGVISLETRRDERGSRVFGAAEAGNEGSSRLVVGGSARGDHWNGRLHFADVRLDDLSQRSERLGFTEADPYDNQTLGGSVGFGFGTDSRLDASAHSSSGTTEVDGFFGEALDATQETQELHVALRYLGRFGDWQQTLRAGASRTDLLGRDSVPSFNVFDIHSRSNELYGETDWQANERNRLTLGYAYEDRQAENLGSFDESATIGSVLLHDRHHFGKRIYVTAAARYDDHSVFGSETTGRLTLAVLANQSGRLHASAGTAFRAPDFNELYFPFAGDLNLLPETSEGIDVGWEQRFATDRGRFDVTWFRTEFDDLIVFDLGTFLFANIAQAKSEGLELESSFRLDHLTVNFNYTWNKTEDRESGGPLPRRPENRASLSFSYSPNAKVRAFAQALRVTDRIESTGETMDDYTRVDLALSFHVNDHVEPYLRVNNVFASQYEEVTGFETPGLLAALGVRFRR